jgi:hypothetical protein
MTRVRAKEIAFECQLHWKDALSREKDMFIRKVGLLKSRSFPFVKKWARHIIQS